MSIRVREAVEADIPRIADVASASFTPATDPIARNLFPNHDLNAAIPEGEAAVTWRRSRKTLKLNSPTAILMVAVDDALDGKVVGFSLWEPPIGDAPETKEPLITCEGLDLKAFQEMKDVVNNTVDKQFGKRGLRDLWYLDYLGVDPKQHRRGIGKALLNWGLERSKEQGRDCYLFATPAGKPLYSAMGFENLGAVDLFGEPHFSMIKRFS